MKELFPTENEELFYIPYTKTESGEFVGAKGCLYNCYKFIRKQLKFAGILTKNNDEVDITSALKEEITDGEPKHFLNFI